MSIKINPARQEVVAAISDFDHKDVESGVAQAALYVPSGAVVVGGFVAVTEAFNSATSDVLDFGTQGKATLYGADIDLASKGVTAIKPSGVMHGADALLAQWNGEGAAPTAGKVRIVLRYVVSGRAAFAHGPEQ